MREGMHEIVDPETGKTEYYDNKGDRRFWITVALGTAILGAIGLRPRDQGTARTTTETEEKRLPNK